MDNSCFVIQPLMTGILIMGPYKPLRTWVDEFIPYYMEMSWDFLQHFFRTKLGKTAKDMFGHSAWLSNVADWGWKDTATRRNQLGQLKRKVEPVGGLNPHGLKSMLPQNRIFFLQFRGWTSKIIETTSST